MKKLFIYALLPVFCTLMTTISFTACGGSDDETDYVATAAMQEALNSEVNNDIPTAPETEKAGEAIDLGLPSGLKWASCNVGATDPEEYGSRYAWGEITEWTYTFGMPTGWSVYKWCNGTPNSLTKYCTDSSYGTVDGKSTLEPADDAARIEWGGNWRTPTSAEFGELMNNCTWESNKTNSSIKITGPNGNHIVLPSGSYWTASKFNGWGCDHAYYFDLYRDMWTGEIQTKRIADSDRCNPMAIRPVRK